MRRDTTTRKRMGRPSALTPDVGDKIIAALRRGNHINTACHLAGVSHAAFYRWMDKAEKAEYALEHGQDFDHGWLVYRDFRERVLRARAEAAETMVDVVYRSAVGGELVEEEPALDGAGNPIRDDDGRVIMKRKWSQPDGRLALSYLKVAQPGEWAGAPSRMELSGPGGGPMAVEGAEPDGDTVSRLAGRITAALAERQAIEASEAAHDDGDVVEGEVVEDA